MAVAALKEFNISSLDIRAAFLQARKLDRPIYMKPPKDLKKNGVIWKLLKQLYGLDDASHKFWLRIKEIFLRIGMSITEDDEAFYFLHNGKDLVGMVLSHVDDFTVAGTDKFIGDIISLIEKELTVSKIEHGSFRFI